MHCSAVGREAVISIGVDVVEIGRVAAAHRRHGERFLRRLFTEGEVVHCLGKKDPYPSLAVRFAAKEAVAKALRTGIGGKLTFRSVGVFSDAGGTPRIVLDGAGEAALQKLGGRCVLISLAHCRRYAVAQAVIC
jgi:holo-[acyl-carrier protein] synthase